MGGRVRGPGVVFSQGPKGQKCWYTSMAGPVERSPAVVVSSAANTRGSANSLALRMLCTRDAARRHACVLQSSRPNSDAQCVSRGVVLSGSRWAGRLTYWRAPILHELHEL